MGTVQEGAANLGVHATMTASGRIERNLTMTPEADDFLAELGRRTGLREGDVLRLALGMFKAAVDAKDQGKHVGIAADQEALDTEFIGF